jgi:hypothetical protein
MRPTILLLIATAGLQGQSQHFDAYTYDAPPGYTLKTHPSSAEWVKIDQAQRFYCQISLYAAQNSLGSPAQDMENEWKAVVAAQFQVKSNPETRAHRLPNAPDSIFRVADTVARNGNPAISTLFVVRFPPRYVGVLLNVPNQQAFEACNKDAVNVAAGIRLATSAPPPPSSAASPAPLPGAVVGVWERIVASATPGRVNVVTRQWEYDPVAAMNQFRQLRRFRFSADGTYTFELDAEDYNRSQRSRVVEKGTYAISGGVISFQPRELVEGKGPRGQDPPLRPAPVPAAFQRRFTIGDHPTYVNSAGLQLQAADGGWETFKPAR